MKMRKRVDGGHEEVLASAIFVSLESLTEPVKRVAEWHRPTELSPSVAHRGTFSGPRTVFLIALAAAPAVAVDLGAGRLEIAGTRLSLSPESQTVPFNTATIVETHLEGLEAGSGTLPPDLRVVAELRGPEIDGALHLETLPNEPFRIPRFSLEGEYRLEDVRLVEGGELLAYAAPRSPAIRVTQVLVTRVTSARPHPRRDP